MRRLVIILTLTSLASAQVQGNLPQLIDSITVDSLLYTRNGVMLYPEPISVGDTIDVCVITQDGLNTAYGVTDSLGNTYTLTSPTQTPNYASTHGLVYHAYTQSSFSGNNTITLAIPPGTAYGEAISRYKGVGSVDGSVATATYAGTGNPGGVGTISTTQTTTTNNDVLSSCAARGAFNNGYLSNNTGEYAAWGFGGSNQNEFMTTQHAGAAGSQTVTVNTWNNFAFGANDSFAMQTLAFKPSTNIAIVDTVLPDVGNNIAYSAQLHCVGGTTTQTYSLFSGSLPTGLSLNTTTGVISGTTTVNGTVSLGFRCTDGTVTSSTATIPLTVWANISTPTIRSVTPNPFDVGGSWGTPVSVSCNDVLVVVARGVDTHYSQGWVQTISGTNNYMNDSFGSTWHRVDTFRPGSPESPLAVYVSSPMTHAGNNTISIFNNTDASSANPVSLILDIGNGEMVDATVGSAFQPGTSSGTFSQSYTSVVANTLLVSLALTDQSLTPAITLSMNSPFTNTLSSGGDAIGTSLWSYALVASPASTTATVNYANANAGTNGTRASTFAHLLIPIRPAPAPNVCVVGNGEKLRRTAW